MMITGTAYKEMAVRLLEEAQLAQLIPSKDARITIKPNLLGQVLAEDGGTTHPEVVAGLIEYLQGHGFQNLKVMEGSWVGDLTMNAVRFCGYDRMLAQYGVPFLDMQKEPGVACEPGGMKINVCAAALETDFLIGVPVLKGHCQTRVTCALKNMKGLIPNSEKRRFHRMGLHAPIAHLAMALPQDFVLVDNICGDLTFEDGGDPVVMNRLIAARDPVLCDAFACSVVGTAPEEVPYITMAAQLGAGSADLGSALIHEVQGEQLGAGSADLESASTREVQDKQEKVQEPATIFSSVSESVQMGEAETQTGPERGRRRADSGFRKVMKLAENVDEVDSCSACYGYLIPALQMLEEDGLLEKLTEKICIGQGWRGKGGELGIGNCTAKFRCTLEGCPPTENQMYVFLRDYILSK